jgi:hypothetical protein
MRNERWRIALGVSAALVYQLCMLADPVTMQHLIDRFVPGMQDFAWRRFSTEAAWPFCLLAAPVTAAGRLLAPDC